MLGAASQVKDFDDKAAADTLRDRVRKTQGVVGDADKHKLVAEANNWFVELMRDKHYDGVAIITRELNISSIDLSGSDSVNVELLLTLITACASLDENKFEKDLLAVLIKNTPAAASGAEALWKKDITADTQPAPCVLAHLLLKMPESRTVSEVVDGLLETNHLNVSNLSWDEGHFPMLELTSVLQQQPSSKWKCLRSLDVSGNNLGAKGAVALAGALKSNSTVQKLDVSANGLGPDGGWAIGSIAENSAITSVSYAAICVFNLLF